jgi:hypothetical protein
LGRASGSYSPNQMVILPDGHGGLSGKRHNPIVSNSDCQSLPHATLAALKLRRDHPVSLPWVCMVIRNGSLDAGVDTVDRLLQMA